MYSNRILVLVFSFFLASEALPVEEVAAVVHEIAKDTVVKETDGRQGILEIPKQVASVIRNVIDESLERLWSTTVKTTKVPAKKNPAAGAASQVTNKVSPQTGSSTRAPTDTFLVEYIMNNYVLETTTLPTTIKPISVTFPLQPDAPVFPTTTVDYELEPEETSVTPFDEDLEVSTSTTVDDPEEIPTSATTPDEDEDVDEADNNSKVV